jgi:MFS family permease
MARDLRLFYLFRLLATSYLWMPISVTFMMAGRGLSWTEVMWLSAIYCGVVILVEIPTGALADRIGRRESMMAGALAMVVSCLLAWHAESFAGFALVQATAALSMSLCSGADSAYLFDLLESHGRADEYPVREGTASAWHLAGHALAFAAGGALGEIDLVLPYLVTAGVAGAAFVVALFLRDEAINTPHETPQRPVGVELRAYASVMGRALGDLFKNRRLMWIMGYSAVAFTLLKVTIDLYQPYLDSRGFSITGRGFVFAGIHVLAALVATRASALRKRFGEDALVWGVMGMLAASFLLLVQVSGALVLVLLAVQAVASGLYSPLVKPMINREIRDSGRRATVLSIESIMRRAAMGLFLIPAALLGSTSAIYLCGGVGLAGGILLWLTARPASAAATPRTDPAPVPRPTTQAPLEARD